MYVCIYVVVTFLLFQKAGELCWHLGYPKLGYASVFPAPYAHLLRANVMGYTDQC